MPDATCLRHVGWLGCSWLKFENGQNFHATFVDVTWFCSPLARLVQLCCARPCALVRFSTPNMSQHVATEWLNARNTLYPTMLLYVASKCCDRLAGACKYWANNVAICCVELLQSFSRGLRIVKACCSEKKKKKHFFFFWCFLRLTAKNDFKQQWSKKGEGRRREIYLFSNYNLASNISVRAGGGRGVLQPLSYEKLRNFSGKTVMIRATTQHSGKQQQQQFISTTVNN